MFLLTKEISTKFCQGLLTCFKSIYKNPISKINAEENSEPFRIIQSYFIR